LNLSDYESDEYRLKSRTDNYDFGVLNKSEHNKCIWWKEIVKKSQQEPIKFKFLKDMVFYEMKSYFYEYIYKDDLEFKNNFQSIFNRFLTEMVNNIINSKIDGDEKYDITSLKNGIKNYLKSEAINESNIDRVYNRRALTNEEDSYLYNLDEWMENKDGMDSDDISAHWVKDGYYDENTNAFDLDPLDATHVWISG
jgi:hypothetical protein